MKPFIIIALFVAAFGTSAEAQVRRAANTNSEEGIYSRTIIHPDETRTVSKQDINNKIREKRTLDKNGILLMRSIFQLDAQGKAVNGLVYDGRNQLLYRSEFTYDTADRLEEERVFDRNGTLVRRLFYKPDRLGKMKPVSQTIFADGGQRTSSGGDLERFSTNSPHAYRGASNVADTPTAYQPGRGSASSSGSSGDSDRREKSRRRFGILRRR